MKSLEYLAAKFEDLEEEVGRLRKQTETNTRWILIATGFSSGVIFVSRALEWLKSHPHF